MNDGLLMSETLAALTTVGALVLAYQFMRRPAWRTAAGLGVVCGLAVLTRAELVLLVPLLALPVVWVAGRDRSAGLRGAAVVLGGLVLVVGPWVGFNLARFQDPTFVSTGDGFALLGANCASTYHGPLEGLWAVSCLPPTMPRGDQSVVNLDYRNRATDYARDHAGHLPVEVLARLGRLLGVYNPGQIAVQRWGGKAALGDISRYGLALTPASLRVRRWSLAASAPRPCLAAARAGLGRAGRGSCLLWDPAVPNARRARGGRLGGHRRYGTAGATLAATSTRTVGSARSRTGEGRAGGRAVTAGLSWSGLFRRRHSQLDAVERPGGEPGHGSPTR